jgi:hypothetical protein
MPHVLLPSPTPQFEFLNPNSPATTLQFAVCSSPTFLLFCCNFRPAARAPVADDTSQGPFCNFDPETCRGDTPPLFDYIDGIDPCLCVDSQTIFDRDLAVGMFRIAIGIASFLLLQCMLSPCLRTMSSEILRKIVEVCELHVSHHAFTL